MSEAEVEVVHRAYQAWKQGGLEGWFALADAEIEWQTRPDLPDSELYKGHDGVRRLAARFEEMHHELALGD